MIQKPRAVVRLGGHVGSLPYEPVAKKWRTADQKLDYNVVWPNGFVALTAKPCRKLGI